MRQFYYFMLLLVLVACKNENALDNTSNSSASENSFSKNDSSEIDSLEIKREKERLSIKHDTISIEDISDAPNNVRFSLNTHPLYISDVYVDSLNEVILIYSPNADFHKKGIQKLTQEYVTEENEVIQEKNHTLETHKDSTQIHIKYKSKHNLLVNGIDFETQNYIKTYYINLLGKGGVIDANITYDVWLDMSKFLKILSSKLYNYALSQKETPIYATLIEISQQLAADIDKMDSLPSVDRIGRHRRALSIVYKIHTDYTRSDHTNKYINDLYTFCLKKFGGRISANGVSGYNKALMNRLKKDIPILFKESYREAVNPFHIFIKTTPKNAQIKNSGFDKADTVHITNEKNIDRIVLFNHNNEPVGIFFCNKVYKDSSDQLFVEYLSCNELPSGDYYLKIYKTHRDKIFIDTINIKKTADNNAIVLVEKPILAGFSGADWMYISAHSSARPTMTTYIDNLSYQIANCNFCEDEVQCVDDLYRKILADCAKIKAYCKASTTIPNKTLAEIEVIFDKLAQNLRKVNLKTAELESKKEILDFELSNFYPEASGISDISYEDIFIYVGRLGPAAFVRLSEEGVEAVYAILLGEAEGQGRK